MTVLARQPAKLDARPRLHVIRGDALDPVAVEHAVAHQDTVILSLGANRMAQQTTLFSDATRVLLAAMKKHQLRRLVAITGVGAGDSKDHGGFVYDHVMDPLFTRPIYEDKNRGGASDWSDWAPRHSAG